MGYNDWGVNIGNPRQLGLGGDIDNCNGAYKGLVKDTDVVAPAQMIMLGETRALPASEDNNSWEANLDPTDTGAGPNGQLPSNRHFYRTDMSFCDGHVEKPLRYDVINPTNNIWRARWNNDNQPHIEVTWSLFTSTALDPSN
jgi:prepilin-type processing-associated H-X9-DG protein